MALSSTEIMKQIQARGKMPNYQQQIAKAYDKPVLRPLVNEAANLEGQYLPALFNPFNEMGTGAADMSPAAKLAAVGGSLGRLGGRIGANNSIQNFYGAQIGDLAGRMSDDWRNSGENMWRMYNALAQREDAAAARAASARAMSMPQFPGFPGGPKKPGGAPGERYYVDSQGRMVPASELKQGVQQLGGIAQKVGDFASSPFSQLFSNLGIGRPAPSRTPVGGGYGQFMGYPASNPNNTGGGMGALANIYGF